MEKITFFSRINRSNFGYVNLPLCEILEIIRDGDLELNDVKLGMYSLRRITEAIRKETNEQNQNDWKFNYLPVVTFNGIWDGTKITHYSNITALDFDYITSDDHLSKVLIMLKNHPNVYAVFQTFKERRIKALIMHDNTDQTKHKEMYCELMNEFGASDIDPRCKDLSRRTYLPWDEDIWINDNCQPYHFEPKRQPIKEIAHTPNTMNSKAKSTMSVIHILNSIWRKKHPEFWQKGNRAISIFKCACEFCEYGVPIDVAEGYFIDGGWIADDFTKEEVIKQVNGAYKCKKNEFGIKYFS